ncbi:MAG TPA: hypothetical protein VH143_08305 [Kofleriaceae bacterium]|jgi:hypothetical protein|nr:hypothetical protein [Kofleriaceae bacterium]
MRALIVAMVMLGACAPQPYELGHYAVDDEPVAVPRAALRPPPDARSVEVAILTSGAARLVAQCKSTYGGGAIAAGLTIAPSGQITRLELQGADGAFADCAAKALHSTTIEPFAGGMVRVDETL